ncbi:MAG: tRNA (adenosine(37)-N6)-threonylcarbamoyltransferase complex ATPase subunit type 1 TsaE [Nibricoccus sp.]
MSIFAELAGGITTRSAAETEEIGFRLAQELEPDRTLALHGNLGVGKTTFVKGLAKGFGVTDVVSSPTFNIFTLHRGGSRLLVHLDAYRLENDHQIESLMLDDFLTSPYCLAVEWPEKIASWLPADALHLDLAITSEHQHHVKLRSAR